jgi:hypothetical protein
MRDNGFDDSQYNDDSGEPPHLDEIASRWAHAIMLRNDYFPFTHFFMAGDEDKCRHFVFSLSQRIGITSQSVFDAYAEHDADLSIVLNSSFPAVQNAPDKNAILFVHGFENHPHLVEKKQRMAVSNRAAHDWIQASDIPYFEEMYGSLNRTTVVISFINNKSPHYQEAVRSMQTSEVGEAHLLIID